MPSICTSNVRHLSDYVIVCEECGAVMHNHAHCGYKIASGELVCLACLTRYEDANPYSQTTVVAHSLTEPR